MQFCRDPSDGGRQLRFILIVFRFVKILGNADKPRIIDALLVAGSVVVAGIVGAYAFLAKEGNLTTVIVTDHYTHDNAVLYYQGGYVPILMKHGGRALVYSFTPAGF